MPCLWKHVAFYISLGVLLGGAVGLVACEDESEWDHPNRQEHPAPPPSEPEERASVEELEERWAEQDERRERGEVRQEDRRLTETVRTVVEAASERLAEAVRVALEETERPALFGDPPVGGGPSGESDEADEEQ